MTQADTPDQGQGRAALLPGWMSLTVRAVELALLIALTGLVARLIWLIAFGASPRATLFLVQAARAQALGQKGCGAVSRGG